MPSSIIGPVIGAIGSLIGGSQAAGAAEDASDAQVRAAEVAAGVSREALGFQREMYNVGRADLAPYRATGAGALRYMNQMFIPGGHPMVQMQGRLNELRAQRARLMSGSQASGQAGQMGPGGVPYNGLANYSDGGGAGGDAAQRFREDFYAATGHEFGDAGGSYDRGVEAAEAYEGEAMSQYERDYGGGDGGDRGGGNNPGSGHEAGSHDDPGNDTGTRGFY